MTALPPEVGPYLRTLSVALRRAYETSTVRPVVLVVVHADRDRDELPAALADVADGHVVEAHPLARAQALARLVAPTVAHRLDEPVRAGECWCLVMGPAGAGVVPISWPDGGELRVAAGS